MVKDPIHLDTYTLQQYVCIRSPKAILNNLPIKKDMTKFLIHLDREKNELILRIAEAQKGRAK